MADSLSQWLYRPGWRLRCIDPPIGWLQLRTGPPLTVAVRLQLTSYLTSRWAEAVRVKDTQLVVTVGERLFVVPSEQVTDVDGVPYPGDDGYKVGSSTPHHAFVDFVTDAPDLVAILRDEGSSLPISVEARLNAANAFRGIASLDLARTGIVGTDEDWRQVGTGRPRQE